MTISNELFAAAERTMHAAGCKPKDVAAILNQLASEFHVECSVEGGLLTMKQTGTLLNVGTVLAAYRQKNPRAFFGESGEVLYKDDLAGDNAAKSRFIAEHGFEAWQALPLNAKSAGAQHVITDVIPSAAMKRSEYLRLSLAEKSKLCGEIGATGIDKILSRK